MEDVLGVHIMELTRLTMGIFGGNKTNISMARPMSLNIWLDGVDVSHERWSKLTVVDSS